jgi:hypothetical protein
MAVYSLGKFTTKVAPNTLEKFSEVQQDVLCFLMLLTKVNRFHTKESFREFLIRYLLIVDKPLVSKAQDFINDGVLIDGTFENKYFCFKVKDLIELIGFESSSSMYNIDENLEHFIQNFSYEAPQVILEQEKKDGVEKYKISTDLLKYHLMGLNTICQIDYLHLSFRENLKYLTTENIESVEKFVDFVVDKIPTNTFDKVIELHPELINCRERFLIADMILFDAYSLPQENLMAILQIIAHEDDWEYLKEEAEITKEFMEENAVTYYITHITFAVGVKWGYIELSEHPTSLNFCLDPLFDVDFDELLGFDYELYSTQLIYDSWNMKEWAYLLPEKPTL